MFKKFIQKIVNWFTAPSEPAPVEKTMQENKCPCSTRVSYAEPPLEGEPKEQVITNGPIVAEVVEETIEAEEVHELFERPVVTLDTAQSEEVEVSITNSRPITEVVEQATETNWAVGAPSSETGAPSESATVPAPEKKPRKPRAKKAEGETPAPRSKKIKKVE